MTARNKQAVRAQIGMEFLLLNSNRRNSVGVLVSYRTFSHDCPFRPLLMQKLPFGLGHPLLNHVRSLDGDNK